MLDPTRGEKNEGILDMVLGLNKKTKRQKDKKTLKSVKF
jgi:hypothetical protein